MPVLYCCHCTAGTRRDKTIAWIDVVHLAITAAVVVVVISISWQRMSFIVSANRLCFLQPLPSPWHRILNTTRIQPTQCVHTVACLRQSRGRARLKLAHERVQSITLVCLPLTIHRRHYNSLHDLQEASVPSVIQPYIDRHVPESMTKAMMS